MKKYICTFKIRALYNFLVKINEPILTSGSDRRMLLVKKYMEKEKTETLRSSFAVPSHLPMRNKDIVLC